jgi:hypothetical protein
MAANLGKLNLTRQTIEAGVRWFDEYFIAHFGRSTSNQPFVVRPHAAMIERAVAAENPISALGNYEHYYGLLLYERCNILMRARTELKPVVVAELGSTHGILANMIMATRENVNYVFIDRRERLEDIRMELGAAYPKKRTLFVKAEGDLVTSNLDDWGMTFVPIEFAEGLAGKYVDLVWTFHGMNGLPDEEISRFHNLVQCKIQPKSFIARARFLNFLEVSDFRNASAGIKGAVLAEAQWTCGHWSFEPSILKCPYVDETRHPRYLEFLLQRLVPLDPESARVRDKRRFLEELSFQGWVEILKAPHAFSSAWGLRPFRLNLAQGGVLERLWHHARRAPGRDVFMMLLHYLDYMCLGSSGVFEEWLFYAAMLKQLHLTVPDSDSTTILSWIGERISEGARSGRKPVPGWQRGYVPSTEPLPPGAVHQLMLTIDVCQTLSS